MRIDFSTPMTFYELLAIVLAAIAIIIPIGQAAYKNGLLSQNFIFTRQGGRFFSLIKAAHISVSMECMKRKTNPSL